MSGLMGILWQEWIIFKRKFWSTTLGMLISPSLYLIAFGWGLGQGLVVEGKPYLEFMVPGLIALNTMMTSFNNTANNINISKLYYKTFENFVLAPMSLSVFVIGKILTGALYGLYSASLIVLVVTLFGGVQILSPYFILMGVLNCLVFSAGGFLAGLLVKSHGDMAKFTNFVITPMSFLCGTFFSLSHMPASIKGLIYILPLTHTAAAMRLDQPLSVSSMVHVFVLALYLVVLMFASHSVLKTVES